MAPGCVQGNVVILPSALASDFLRFCQANPKPCPLLAVSEPGDPALPALGADIDMRSDVPRYRVFRHGELVEEPTDIGHLWRDDLVSFILGCSFSFEWALLEDGLRLRHQDEGGNVPMYRTSIQTVAAGRFRGPLVVSMRPFRPADAIRAIQITSRFPGVHGAPVHIGKPELIGIRDLARPDWGDAVTVADGRIAGVLGLRRDAASRDRRGQTGFLHHPRTGLDADHRFEQQPTRHSLAPQRRIRRGHT